MRIDSHQHFWDLSRSDYNWLTPDMKVLYRNYGPDELAPILRREKIDGTLLVQASETVEETRYLLDIAEKTPFVLGVVGWVDLSAPEATKLIEELRVSPYLKGLRPMLQDIAQTDWILMDELKPALKAMVEAGLTFDALITPRHTDVIMAFAENNPELKIVIDHAAKPNFRTNTFDVWAKAMDGLSQNKNVFCKLSGLWTEANGDVSDENIRPYIHHLANCFGSGKLMWGSDWPVVNVAGKYSAWIAQAERLLERVENVNMDQCFGKTAEQVYGL